MFQLLKFLEITRQYFKVWVDLLISSEMQFYNLAAKIQNWRLTDNELKSFLWYEPANTCEKKWNFCIKTNLHI